MRARSIPTPLDRDDLDLGFATFLLNRCNRSGILNARPIGGLQQDGYWKIDARFNSVDLANRVRTIGAYRDRVSVTQLDARDFIAGVACADVLLYVDPPYLGQGDDLYMDMLRPEDHAELAALLRTCRSPWLLTYDADKRITDELYVGMRAVEFDIAHTAQRQHVGFEYAVFGPNVVIPNLEVLGATQARWVTPGDGRYSSKSI